jgi:hypothetical protein
MRQEQVHIRDPTPLSQYGTSVLVNILKKGARPEVVKHLLDHKADATAVDKVPYSCLLL